MSPTTKKHRATAPVAASADLPGGAHRASRLAETIIALTLGTVLIVLTCYYLALRG